MSDEDFDWRRAFDLSEPDPNRTSGRSHTKAGWKLYHRGNYKRALSKAVKAIEVCPLDCSAYLLAGACLREAPDTATRWRLSRRQAGHESNSPDQVLRRLRRLTEGRFNVR